MTEKLYNFIADNQADVEAALRARLPLSSLPAARRLNEALHYAIFPGGKRLRPMLSLLASALVGVPRSEGLTLACAVEFLHSSSLIIDDLPGMDDANLRRNRRTLHLVYGEGIAMLAALALLNQSYALFAQAARACGHTGAVESLLSEATQVVGAEGMIGGQAIDLELKTGCADVKTLAGRDLKTVALMRLMMTASAFACDADEAGMSALREFGECFGRAYQACDDLLDEKCGSYLTGKPAGQDARHRRATSLSAFGAQTVRRMAVGLIERGTSSLALRFGERFEVQLLTDAAYHVINRFVDDERSENLRLPSLAHKEVMSAGD